MTQDNQSPVKTNYAISGSIGTVGGSALSTDSDPNSVAPSDARLFYSPPVYKMPANILDVYPVGGTTVTVAPWFFDATSNRWLQIATAAAATPTAPAHFSNTPFGAKLFLQITSNTGVPFTGLGFR